MIVEPAAGDRVEDNLNPVGRAYYGFSTLLCTPASLSQEVGLALGAQAGEARIRERRHQRRPQPLPPGQRDAVQPGVRGTYLISGGAAARRDKPVSCPPSPAAGRPGKEGTGGRLWPAVAGRGGGRR